MVTLRELIKRCFSIPCLQVDEAIKLIQKRQTWDLQTFWTQCEVVLEKWLPMVQDKMEYHRKTVEELELGYGFDL